jgi:hypothetical protein
MQAFVITAGAIFGLITLVHVWRMVEEPQLATEPWFLVLTGLSAVLSLWAFGVARRKRQP